MGKTFGDRVDEFGNTIGFNPTIINQNAPGASLDASQADMQRKRMEDFISALQQQAATGDGAWRQQFSDAVRRSRDAATALGSSSPGTDYGSAQRNIATAQGATNARAAGDEEILRARSQLDARNQLAGALNSQSGMDIGQAAEQARIERERRAANQASIDQTLENRQATEKATSMGMGSFMSKGGEVPGKPKVFGDDYKNDTVPAKLSPEEIVIPRSIATQPDAPERAAAFVRAVKAGYNPRSEDDNRFADGGDTGVGYGKASDLGFEGYGAYFINPQLGRAMQYNKMRQVYGQGAGGQLDMSQYQQTAGQQNQLASLFAGQAAGSGPSIANAHLQRTTDAYLGAAGAAGREGMPQSVAMQRAAEAGVGAGAESAQQKQLEQSEGQGAYSQMLSRRRGQELQAASAQQQAAWEKTMADAGMSLKNQALVRGTIAGAGQGAAAFASAGRGGGGGDAGPGGGDTQGDSLGMDNPVEGGDQGGDDLGGGGDTEGDRMGMAFGGVIGLADGGYVYDVFDKKKSDETGAPEYETQEFSASEPKVRRNVSAWNSTSKPSAQVVNGKAVAAGREAKPDRAADFVRAVKAAGDYAKRASTMAGGAKSDGTAADAGGAARNPVVAQRGERDDDSDLEVQRAYGGAVRMADGGDVPGFDPYVFDVRRGAGPQLVDPEGNPMVAPSPADAPADTGPSFLQSVGLDSAYNARKESEAARAKQLAEIEAKKTKAEPKDPAERFASLADKPVGAQGGPPPAVNVAASEAVKRGDVALAPPKAEERPAAAPVAAPTRAAGAAPNFGAKADDESREAARQAAAYTQAEADARAQAAAAEANAIESQVNERKALAAKVQERLDSAKARFDEATKEAASIDTTVDPGRFWASRSTGDKVVGIIGLVLGALGAGPDGVNRAALMLDKAIDRDLEAQKAEHELRLRKGAAKVDTAKSFYAMAREAAGDELGAMDLAHAAALNAVSARGKEMLAKTGNQQAKAQLSGLLASIDQAKAQRQAAGWEKAQDRALEREKIDVERTKAGAGAANAAKDLKDAEAASNTALDTIKAIRAKLAATRAMGQAVSPVPGAGTIVTGVAQKVGPTAAAMDVDVANLKSQLKDAEKLGALSKDDYALLTDQIGDPSAFFATEGSKDAKLAALEARIRNAFENKKKAMGAK